SSGSRRARTGAAFGPPRATTETISELSLGSNWPKSPSAIGSRRAEWLNTRSIRLRQGLVGRVKSLMPKIRMNGDLRGTPRVRVLAASGEDLGVMPLSEALRLAMKEGLDLVEVNPLAQPLLCKLLDFAKFKYEAAKGAKGEPETDDDE